MAMARGGSGERRLPAGHALGFTACTVESDYVYFGRVGLGPNAVLCGPAVGLSVLSIRLGGHGCGCVFGFETSSG
jgi:hypothetical protein